MCCCTMWTAVVNLIPDQRPAVPISALAPVATEHTGLKEELAPADAVEAVGGSE